MTAARIRQAHPGDADALHELHCATWREAYADLVPESVLRQREDRGSGHWLETLSDPAGDAVWLGHRDGVPVGFATAHAAGTAGPRPLCLQALYVRTTEYGQGRSEERRVGTGWGGGWGPE